VRDLEIESAQPQGVVRDLEIESAQPQGVVRDLENRKAMKTVRKAKPAN
jgi:hypothetical protein